MSEQTVGDGIRRPDPRRIDYDGDGLTEDQLLDTPYAQARAWVDDAVARAEGEPPTCSSRWRSRSPRSTTMGGRTCAPC